MQRSKLENYLLNLFASSNRALNNEFSESTIIYLSYSLPKSPVGYNLLGFFGKYNEEFGKEAEKAANGIVNYYLMKEICGKRLKEDDKRFGILVPYFYSLAANFSQRNKEIFLELAEKNNELKRLIINSASQIRKEREINELNKLYYGNSAFYRSLDL
ncbi:MAG: hypothetical protein ABGW69_02390 [Nanoarchaeota archaeon]